jgi:hypothetical protein
MIAAKLPELHGLLRPKNPFSTGLACKLYVNATEVERWLRDEDSSGCSDSGLLHFATVNSAGSHPEQRAQLLLHLGIER